MLPFQGENNSTIYSGQRANCFTHLYTLKQQACCGKERYGPKFVSILGLSVKYWCTNINCGAGGVGLFYNSKSQHTKEKVFLLKLIKMNDYSSLQIKWSRILRQDLKPGKLRSGFSRDWTSIWISPSPLEKAYHGPRTKQHLQESTTYHKEWKIAAIR